MSSLTYRTQGFVLDYFDIGEADRIYTVYSEDFGLLKLFARGVRFSKSKLVGHMLLFSKSRLAFVYGRDILHLIDAEIINNFNALPAFDPSSSRGENHKRICLSESANRQVRSGLIVTGFRDEDGIFFITGRISRFFMRLIRGEEKDSRVWSLLCSAFQFLAEYKKTSGPDIFSASNDLSFFELLLSARLLHALGYVGASSPAVTMLICSHEWPSVSAVAQSSIEEELVTLLQKGLRISQL